MLFSEISPYIRYARYVNLNRQFHFNESVPVDARLFYTLDGYGKIKVKGKEYAMSTHSLLIVNAGVPYCIATPEDSVSYIMLNFDYTKLAATNNLPIPPVPKEKFKKEMLVDSHTFEDVKSLSEVLYIPKIPLIKQRLSEIVKECTQKLLYYENKSSHMLAECIADCLRASSTVNTVGAKKENELTSMLLSYIHEHFHQSLTNVALGNAFGYHPNYVNQLIKAVTGMSVHSYVIHVRMMHAVSLLENTSLPIGEIALQCGFCDLAYFSQYFKKHFGICPSKYRDS